jgi:SAM-dependent methyltransferase
VPEPDPDYGAAFADVYDDWYGHVSDLDGTVARVAELAGAGLVLELGVGTGRIALALAARGIDVVGIDSSPAMLEVLAAKPGADRVRVVPGDMAECATLVDGPVAVVLVAFNTLFNLTTEDAQRRCLAGVAGLLAPGGSLLVEAFVPGAGPDRIDRRLTTSRVDLDRVVLTATEHDPATQVVTGQHLDITAGGVRMRPWRIRYAHPDQLDALARSAGLELVERWAGWRGEPFDEGSTTHVSRYRR